MKKSKLGAAALVGALGAAGVLGLSTAAYAAPANIDVDQPRSLTVHAYEEGEGGGLPTDGNAVDPAELAGLVPLEGVGFSVSQVTAIGGTALDLNDTESWDFLAPYLDGTQTFDPAGATLATAVTGTTGANGQVVFDNQPVGAFWVQQTGTGMNNSITTMDPFLITLPLPGPTPGEWIYDVHAYPKNAVINGEKTVDESQALGLGSTVSWEIRGDIPLDTDGLTTYTITDTLPAGVTYTEDSLDVTVTTRDPADADRVDMSADNYTLDVDGQTVTVDFNAEGFGFFNQFTLGSVYVNFDTTVNDIGTGTLVNTVDFNVNGTVFNAAAQTTWGAVDITKHVAGDEDNVLGGAEFQVFASLDEATSRTNPVDVAGVTTFTTDNSTGITSISGLHAAVGGTNYWLVETKAPTGYLANTTPQEINVTPGSTSTALQVAVPNEQAPAGSLPVLGGTGAMIAGVLGALAIAGGAVIAITGRRKKAEAQV